VYPRPSIIIYGEYKWLYACIEYSHHTIRIEVLSNREGEKVKEGEELEKIPKKILFSCGNTCRKIEGEYHKVPR